MYKIIAFISVIIRNAFLPNPFEPLGDIVINIFDVPFTITPDFLNFIFEAPLHLLTFAVVGLYYLKGSCPSIGSIFYLIFYVVHVFLIYVCSWFDFSWVVIAVVLSIYFLFHLLINILRLCRRWIICVK